MAIMAMSIRSRTIAATVLLIGLSLAQQRPTETLVPTFQVDANLVMVPFAVRRGNRQIADLKPADVVLLEDGVPRGFTVFEAPPEHPSLELVMMFDFSNIGGGFWDPKNIRDLSSHWNEGIVRSVLEGNGITTTVSVYQFNQRQLRRLGRSLSDPKELLEALRRLPNPLPADQPLPLALPRNVVVPEPKDDRIDLAHSADATGAIGPKPWSLVGASTALKDSAAVPGKRDRVLVVFSKGVDDTTITPRDLAAEAMASDIPVYPVAFSVAHAVYVSGGLGSSFHPFNEEFERLGDLTGGLPFEVSDSLTAGKVRDIVEAVKIHASNRINSRYSIGFVPTPSDSPREHKLEVKLLSKSSGKLSGASRNAKY